MKKAIFAAALLLLAACTAFADGYSELDAGDVESLGRHVRFQSYSGGAEGYESGDRLGVCSSDSHTLTVVSKTVSIWKSARTNSSKLGSASNGTVLECELDDDGEPETDGSFYRVRWNGNKGWVNCEYVVLDPLEIVLMESNVPAYCAPYKESKKVGSLSKMTRYTVIGLLDDFYIVNLRGGSAFIPTDVKCYDSIFEARVPEDGMTAELIHTTTCRTGPGEEYPEACTMKKGSEVTLLGELDGWYIAEYSSGTDGRVFVYIDPEDVETEDGVG